LGSLLRIGGPILPAGAGISPAATVATLLAEAALNGTAGRHIVTSRMIARAADGLVRKGNMDT
jgi:hypothetical protein